MPLVLVTAATVEPVSLAEAQAQARVTDAGDDALLRDMIKAAREDCENLTGRVMVTSTWDLYLDAFPAGLGPVVAPASPLQSVSSVTYLDTAGATKTLATPSGYKVDTASLLGRIYLPLGASWPETLAEPNAVKVRLVAGWPLDANGNLTTPAALRQWMQRRVASLYEQREDYVVGQSVAEMPRNFVDSLLAPYAIPRVA
ncbi:MAG: hypothetical protein HY794_18255 [Desulfarculus sp.]|nr:hypothetical protein [Desulfarculus sp.]